MNDRMLERAELFSQLNYNNSIMSFFGLRFEQNLHGLLNINRIINMIRPRRIVKIGNGQNGLSSLLTTYSFCSQCCEILLYEPFLIPKEKIDFLEILGQESFKFDINENYDFISKQISSEFPSILICESMQVECFKKFAPHLKNRDVVMLHNYASTKDFYEKNINKKLWNKNDLIYSDIKNICDEFHVQPISPSEFWIDSWFVGMKVDKKEYVQFSMD